MRKTVINIQELRERIGDRAKSAPSHRFWGLYVHVKKLDTLRTSYMEAKRNNGSPGSDGVTFAQIEQGGLTNFLQEIAKELTENTYKPMQYRKVEIPKANGKTRVISIPSIKDRVVHGALKLILEPILEADFSPSSFGARPGRRAHEALYIVQQAAWRKKELVVDVDLSAFFDNITHSVILSRLAKRVQDPNVLALIKQFFKSAGKKGIPQGSPLSPLMANLALTQLDNMLDKGQGFITYVRYLDDMVILTYNTPKGHQWANRALQRIEKEAKEIGVSINLEKTKTVIITEKKASFGFLGFEFRWAYSSRGKKYFPLLRPKKNKVTTLMAKIKDYVHRRKHMHVRDIVKGINPIIRGWVNYFKVGHSKQTFNFIRMYIEKMMRRLACKQRGLKGFGWKRWSNEIVYGNWGLFNDYKTKYLALMEFSLPSKRHITP